MIFVVLVWYKMGRGFSSVHFEIGGGVSFAFLHCSLKFWCPTTSNSSSRIFKRCYENVNSLFGIDTRGTRDKEANYLRFTIQMPLNLICIPRLSPHVVWLLKLEGLFFYRNGTRVRMPTLQFLKKLLDDYNLRVHRETFCVQWAEKD